MKKYVISWREGVQLTPDGGEVITRTLVCNEDTTLKQIATKMGHVFFTQVVITEAIEVPQEIGEKT